MHMLNLAEWLQIFQIGVIAVGGIAVLATLRANVRELTRRIIGVEAEVNKLVDVLVTIGRQDERILGLERRISLVENIQIIENPSRSSQPR